MSKRGALAILLVIFAVAGLSYAGWRLVQSRNQEMCDVCRRPAHGPARTAGVEGNHKAVFCCLACARSEKVQSHGRVEIADLTDFVSQKPVDPGSAFVVRNSDFNPCHDRQAHFGEHKQPLASEFDRCAPSALAFGSREAALAFAREHGGQVVSFSSWWGE